MVLSPCLWLCVGLKGNASTPSKHECTEWVEFLSSLAGLLLVAAGMGSYLELWGKKELVE